MINKTFLTVGTTVLLVAAIVYSLLPSNEKADANTTPLTPSEALRRHNDVVQNAVFFDIDHAANIAVAVGEQGRIRRSSDGGKTWQVVASPTSSTLLSVEFFGPKSVWAAGHQGVILHSVDAGETWQTVSYDKALAPPEMRDFAIFDILSVANETLYMSASNGILLFSEDGGETWQRETFSHYTADNDLFHLSKSTNGDILVSSSQGYIHHLNHEQGEWQPEKVSWSASLNGTLVLPNGELIAFGREGFVYEKSDTNNNWRTMDSPSKADLYTGLVRQDGTIILAGSNGVLMRKTSQANSFLIDYRLTQGAVLALEEMDDGSLLIAGQAGLGRLTTEGYQFIGGDGKTAGELRRRQILAMPFTQELLNVAAPENAGWGSSYRPAEPLAEPAWISLTIAAGPDEAKTEPSDHDSLLSPAIFGEVDAFHNTLSSALYVGPVRLHSLWSDAESVPSMTYSQRRDRISVKPSAYGYDYSAQRKLTWRLGESGLTDVYISQDGHRATFSLSQRDERKPLSDASISQKINTLFDEEASFHMASLERFKVQEVAVPVVTDEKNEPAEKPTPATVDAYTLSLSPDITSCERLPTITTAAQLEVPVNDLPGTGAVVTVAGRSAVLRAQEHRANWRWFAPGDTASYSSLSYEPWGDNYCPRALMVLYSSAPKTDLRPALSEILNNTLSSSDEGYSAKDIEIKAYRLTRSSLMEENQ